jgi:two-component system LytT family response regulator
VVDGARLDPDRFARVHRSEIVNVEAIKEIRTVSHGDDSVPLKNGDEVRGHRLPSQRD